MSRQHLEGLYLVGALLLGGLLGEQLAWAPPSIPWIIAGMLFLTFTGLEPRSLALKRSHGVLLLIQGVLMTVGYTLGLLISREIALTALICTLIPVATASPVVVRLLGGDAGYITTYILLSHCVIVLIAPLILPLVGDGQSGANFIETAVPILLEVAKLVLPALFLGQLLRLLRPKLAHKLGAMTKLSYTLWMLSLILLMAHTRVMIEAQDGSTLDQILLIALVSGGIAIGQFTFGHYLGQKLWQDAITIRHSLGQKNTTLGLWLSALFLPPLIAFACASYILAQNAILIYLLSRSKR